MDSAKTIVSGLRLCSSNAHSPNSSKPHCSLRPSQAVLAVPVLILKIQTPRQFFCWLFISNMVCEVWHWCTHFITIDTPMTIDHQGACECTSKVATSEMWFGQSGKRQKKNVTTPANLWEITKWVLPQHGPLAVPRSCLCVSIIFHRVYCFASCQRFCSFHFFLVRCCFWKTNLCVWNALGSFQGC